MSGIDQLGESRPGVKLSFNYISASMVGENRHAEKVMRELGIKWESCEGVPMADSVWFYGCTNLPNVLPRYIYNQSEETE